MKKVSHHNNVHYCQQLLNLFQGDYTGKGNNYSTPVKYKTGRVKFFKRYTHTHVFPS